MANRNYITTIVDDETAAAIKWAAKKCETTVCELIRELISRQITKMQIIEKYKAYENNNRDKRTTDA